jgi:ferric-dicitrate binding protein FerR (iron transport regulator)
MVDTAEDTFPVSDEDEFAALVLRHLDGLTTADETAVLLAELESSADRRTQTVALCRQHGTLTELLASQQQRQLLLRRTSVRSRRLSWVRWAVGVAAAVLLAGGIYFATRSPQREAAAAVARLEQIHGEVQVIAAAGNNPVRAKQELFVGQGLQIVGETSRAVVVYPDGTRLELGPDTVVGQLVEPADRSKKVALTRGVLTASVAPQPEGRPFVLLSEHAEVVVRGTRFSCSCAPETTHIEVAEGQVQFTDRSDGRTIAVAAGQTAVAGPKALRPPRGVPWPTPPPPARKKAS